MTGRERSSIMMVVQFLRTDERWGKEESAMSATLLDEVVHGSIAPLQKRREQVDYPWTEEEVRVILATTATLLQAIVHLFEQHCDALLGQGTEASKVIAGLEQLIERHTLIRQHFEESKRFAKKTGFESQLHR